MDRPLKVLVVEDVERDAVLLVRELRRGGYELAYERVETAEAMAAALQRQAWDIIISDYVMPHFSALKALALMKEKRLELPFIIVSGTITEEIAAGALRAGAHDFMVKGKLARLLPAIERELAEAAGRAERKKMRAQLLIAVQKIAATDAREAEADTRDTEADTRDTEADTRDADADTRDAEADTRDADADTRDADADTRDSIAETRERRVVDREELTRLREDAVSAREEADRANADRDRLHAQTLAMNRDLVLATLKAQELADEAEVARAKIAESEERFRSLVTTSAAIVWQADALGRHLDSPSWTAFTGLSLLDLSLGPGNDGEGLRAIHPDDRESAREAWMQATTHRSLYVAEFRLQRRDGSYAWMVSRAVPIPAAPAPIREWVGMTTDISDSKRVEEAREQFIGILAHDLRNPLGAIAGTAALLGHATDIPERHARNFARIGRNTQRMTTMIRDVLDFTRGRLGGGIPIERELCDLGDICAEAVEEMKQAHPGRAIDLETIGDLSGEWDPARIEQMLSNLIGNAVHYGQDPIKVGAHADDDVVIVTLHNMGSPIPAALLPTLFEPFRRGERSGSQGLGLGLYIVSEIVRAHGASVSVSSSEHDGTKFTVQWPRRMPTKPLAKPHGVVELLSRSLDHAVTTRP